MKNIKLNTTATKPGWLLYYILETYQLIKSISGKQKKNRFRASSGKT